MKDLIHKIDAILPQTQCTKCGYPDCKAYATAMAEGAPHNQCPPGGDDVIAALSKLLDRKPQPLNPKNGQHNPKLVAHIRENECIGCVKCIKACPVDAIIGTGKMMHTVLTNACTGCDLCVPACPMDCIDMIPAKDDKLHRDQWRTQRKNHNNRLAKAAEQNHSEHQKNIKDKQAYIAAALKRVQR